MREDSDGGDEWRLLGAILLGLVSDWDAWVSRRVDNFRFAGDDERVLHRHQSVDFTIPPSLMALDRSVVERLGGLPVPLTFVSKWRLPEFSLRDESDRAISLMPRTASTRLAGAMLEALATFVRSEGHSIGSLRNPSTRLPTGLKKELTAIVERDSAAALRRCVEFGQHDGDPDTRRSEEGSWRHQLARSELFMSLAYELAVGFPLVALVAGEHRPTSRLVKFSYNSFVVPAEHDRLRTRFAHGWRWLLNRRRDAVDPVEWKRSSSRRRLTHAPPDPLQTGRMVLTSSHGRDTERLKQGGAAIAAGTATIEGPNGKQTVRIRPSGIISIAGMPPGSYRVDVEAKSGFRLTPAHNAVEVHRNEVTRLQIQSIRIGFVDRDMLAPSTIAAPAWRPKQIARGFGWSSKPLAIRVRLGEGGEYRCEFEAPAGLHVTRAKLISNLAGNEAPRAGRDDGDVRARNVHTALESKQVSYLESAPPQGKSSTGYALLNLRPRVETIVRPAFFTALLTWLIVVSLALGWTGFDASGNHSGNLLERIYAAITGKAVGASDPPWGLLAVLLGGPSALAAYFAQAVPSRVTNAMLYGVRLTALLPVLLSLATAAILLSSPAPHTELELIAVGMLALIATLALWVSYRYAEHPPEQRPSRQGVSFKQLHLEDGRGNFPRGGGREVARMIQDEAGSEAVRDRMLERIGGLTPATRRALLGQRTFLAWEREVPPALYFDSAESPAIFLGFDGEEETRKIKALIDGFQQEGAGTQRVEPGPVDEH